MQKPLPSSHADREPDQDATDNRVVRFPGLPDHADRTFMCAVLFLDIVEYSKKPVSEQLRAKERFNALISEAIQSIATNDRIILDTGDGVAVNFLGDAEDALLVALHLSQGIAALAQGEPAVEVRIGVNLGPVRLVRDGNGQPNIIGDGLNVAERVMSFARPGQVLISRSYYEAVTRVSEDYARWFAYQGSRTDKHVREHEIFEVAGSTGEALELATRRHRARPAGRSGDTHLTQSAQSSARSSRRGWLRSATLAYAGAAVSVATLLAVLIFHTREPGDKPAVDTAKPAAAEPVRAPEPPPTPPSVAQAPVVLPAPPEPARPVKPPALRKDKPAHKPKPAAKLHKPLSRAADTAALRTKPAPVPEVPAPPKAAAIEEPAPVSTRILAKAAAGPTALIMLAVSPWGEVVVDGQSVGVSPPLSELELAPGRHRIEIRNSGFKPYQETFELDPNQTVRIKYKFK
jgi:class 3 adenylate cyclase